jgi:hypothetical protein
MSLGKASKSMKNTFPVDVPRKNAPRTGGCVSSGDFVYEVTSPSITLIRGVEMVSTSKKSHLSTKSERIVGPNSQLLRVDNNKGFFLAIKTRCGGRRTKTTHRSPLSRGMVSNGYRKSTQ